MWYIYLTMGIVGKKRTYLTLDEKIDERSSLIQAVFKGQKMSNGKTIVYVILLKIYSQCSYLKSMTIICWQYRSIHILLNDNQDKVARKFIPNWKFFIKSHMRGKNQNVTPHRKFELLTFMKLNFLLKIKILA